MPDEYGQKHLVKLTNFQNIFETSQKLTKFHCLKFITQPNSTQTRLESNHIQKFCFFQQKQQKKSQKELQIKLFQKNLIFFFKI